MMNDIYDLDTQKKVRYVSESSNTSGYSTMSPGPSVHGGGGIIGGIVGGAAGNISPASSTLFSMPPSPALSPATAALQNDFSNLNLPSNSPQQLPLPQQQQQPPPMQQQFTTLQNVPHVYANLNYNNYSNVMQCQPTTAAANTATMSISSSLHIKSEYNAQLRILEQPAEKFRFRYKSEMHGTHGSLNGVNSKRTPKTFPEVQLENFSGNAVIRCSLFQTDIDSPHSHQLVVRKDDLDICDPHNLYVSQDKGYVAQFQNMGIIHTAKKFIFEELLKKKKNRFTFELGRNDLSTREEQELRKETEKEAKAMNLNQVRLCFEAFKIEEDGTWTRIAAPVCTHSINNRKSAQTGELRICRLSIASGSVSGGDDLILLVEKVSKKNIKVRFYEINDDEETVWEAYGKFRESDVHHQYAIVCTTPAYKNKDIDKPVEVFIELIRPSDDERSFPPVTFRYKPRDAIVSRKRRRTCSTATTSSSSSNSMSSFELPKILQEQANVMQPPTAAMTTEYQHQQQQLQQHQLMLQQQQQQQHQLGGPPTISEEFNKDQQLRNLYNSEEFRQMINTNSEELRIICDSFPLEGYLEHDGISSSSSSSFSLEKNHGNQSKKFIQSKQYISTSSAPLQTNNLHLQRIFKLYHETRNETPNTSRHVAVAKQVSDIFIEFATKNEEFDSIIHEIIMTDNVKLGIKTCEILKFFNLEELLNTSINSNGESCLHCACLHNKAHFIRPLLLLDCDPNIQDHIGNTALHIAVQERNKSCIESFLIYMSSSAKLRVNLKLTNDAGLTPLHLAIRNNMLDNIEKFLRYDKSAVLVCNTKDGNNALHMAVLQQNIPLIKLIMELHNVNLETRNAAGRTVLDLTKMLDPAARKEILELLLQTNTENDLQQPTVKLEDTESSSSTEDDEEVEEDEQMQEPLELVKMKCEIEESNAHEPIAALDLDAKLHKILCDDIKFRQLSQTLDIEQRWKPLAKQLKMQHLLCLWSSADAMLKYVRDNVQSIGYVTFTEALALVDKDTLKLLQSI